LTQFPDVQRTRKVGVAMPVPVGAVGGVGGVAPAWSTVTGVPAIVNVPVRAVVAVFAATVTVAVPPPVLLAGVTVSQAVAVAAVHAQLEPLAVTVTEKLSPPAGDVCAVGVAPTVHDGGGAAACVTATLCPLTVRPAVR
jgi:hypothetical protein